MDYLIICALIAEVLILSRLDKRVFGTWFTPFNFLGYPYMVVVVSAFLLAPPLGFVSVYTPSILIWIVGLLLFWGTGFTLGLICDFRTGSRLGAFGSKPTPTDDSTTKLVTKIAWATVPFMAFSLYKAQAATGGWFEIGSYDFKVAYVHGLSAHAVQLAQPVSVYLLGTYRKKHNLQFAAIVVLLLFQFLTFVKGTILSAIIAAMIFRAVRENLKVPVKKIIICLVITYVVFNAVYLVGFSVVDPSTLSDPSVYGVLARHYMYYLWAGVLSFGQALRTGVGRIGGPWYVLFAPFINIYRALLGAGPVLIAISPQELGMDVDLTNASTVLGSNVYTMLGTLYFYMGALGAVLVMIVFALLSYALLLVCKIRDNDWLLCLYCIFGSWLVFGFFDYYFASLGFPETVVDCLLLSTLVKWVRNRQGASAPANVQSQLAPHVL
jgi:hypothetical protein